MPDNDMIETGIQRCQRCGRAVLPTGIYAMPVDGFCECIFWR